MQDLQTGHGPDNQKIIPTLLSVRAGKESIGELTMSKFDRNETKNELQARRNQREQYECAKRLQMREHPEWYPDEDTEAEDKSMLEWMSDETK